MAMQTLVIATRESALALWQAEHVAARLRVLHPELAVRLLPMTTRGDQILDRPLSQIGGKGLFLKELEIALLEGRAHLAVHSLKDVPMQLDQEFQLVAVTEREQAFDAFVSPRFASVAELPLGARVGSSSLRRQMQLHLLRPDLQVADLRGNVQTRLRKLDEGHYDAIILAAAGLERLGLRARITGVFNADQMLPAVGQGALAIECLTTDAATAQLLAPLNHRVSAQCASAERAVARRFGGNCQVPLAAYAQIHEGDLRLRAMIGDQQAQNALYDELSGPASQADELGTALAERMLAAGASALL